MNNINDLNVLKEIIIKSNAKMMIVFFVKKDGTIRKLYAKTGIKKHLSKNPNRRKVNKSNGNLISVYYCEN